MSVTPHDVVVVREAVWRVLDIEPGDGCRAVRLERLDPPPRGLIRTFIEPFDPVRVANGRGTPTVVSTRRALGAARALIAGDRRWNEPLSAAAVPVVLRPWQLAPAVTVLSGDARRLLVADAVGLGKTVQAGLLICELLARGPSRRALVLVPAGLRAQWQAELARHFDLAAVIADLGWLERQTRALPRDVNPWTRARLVICSLDFAKRDEVLPGPQDSTWDLVVVDEAHGLGTGTARAALVEAVCRNARAVLLLTATPHSGQPSSFDALCRLGATGGEPSLVVLRRNRHQVSAARTAPRWRILRATPSDAEAGLARLLGRYIDALERQATIAEPGVVALLVQILRKRAASGAWAIGRTVRRRRALITGQVPMPHQPALPFDAGRAGDDDGEAPDGILAVSGMIRPEAERSWLGAIAEAADRAARHDSRLDVLQRYLQRAAEPVLIFTEYRDTLAYLARRLTLTGSIEVIHGGMAPRERETAVARFTIGSARLLLATDAASEGLNLHERCRGVVLWDLPWTPTRLAQRVGRVDRLGQTRRVHVVALVRRDDDFDAGLLQRLEDRRARIDAALESGGPAGPPDSILIPIAQRLSLRRAVGRAGRRAAGSAQPAIGVSGGWRRGWSDTIVTCLDPSPRRQWSGLLMLVDAQLDAGSDVIDRAVVGVLVPAGVPRLRSRAAVRRFMSQHAALAASAVASARQSVEPRWQASLAHWRAFTASGGTLPPVAGEPSRPVAPGQPSLFGRYTMRTRWTAAPAADVPSGSGGVDVLEPVLSERCRLAVVLLGPGPGQPGNRRPVDDDAW